MEKVRVGQVLRRKLHFSGESWRDRTRMANIEPLSFVEVVDVSSDGNLVKLNFNPHIWWSVQRFDLIVPDEKLESFL